MRTAGDSRREMSAHSHEMLGLKMGGRSHCKASWPWPMWLYSQECRRPPQRSRLHSDPTESSAEWTHCIAKCHQVASSPLAEDMRCEPETCVRRRHLQTTVAPSSVPTIPSSFKANTL